MSVADVADEPRPFLYYLPMFICAKAAIAFISLIIASIAIGKEPKDSIAVAAALHPQASSTDVGPNVNTESKGLSLSLSSSAELIAAVRDLHDQIQRYLSM